MKYFFMFFLGAFQLWGLPKKPVEVEANQQIAMSQVLTLGAIQGITEFLPVSSTGHMILANDYFFHTAESQKSLWDDYLICIQLGTIITLLIFYRHDVKRILRGCLGQDTEGFCLGWNVGLAFIPVGLLGFLCDSFIQEKLYNKPCIAFGLLLGGLLIFFIESWRRRQQPRYLNVYTLTAQSAISIGLFQCVALWPGFSRSLATIVGGLIVGLNLIESIHFSFLLGLLTSSVATLYKLLKHNDVLIQMMSQTFAWIGIGVAFLLGMTTIHCFLQYLQKYGLKLFGYYRIFLAIILSIL